MHHVRLVVSSRKTDSALRGALTVVTVKSNVAVVEDSEGGVPYNIGAGTVT